MKPNDLKATFQWEDPLLLEDQLTEDERMVRDSARAYCSEKLMPRVVEAHRHERFDREYFPTADGDNNISPGAPRTVRLTLSTNF